MAERSVSDGYTGVDIPVALEVDGHLIETKKVTVAAGASGTPASAAGGAGERNHHQPSRAFAPRPTSKATER